MRRLSKSIADLNQFCIDREFTDGVGPQEIDALCKVRAAIQLLQLASYDFAVAEIGSDFQNKEADPAFLALRKTLNDMCHPKRKKNVN